VAWFVADVRVEIETKEKERETERLCSMFGAVRG